MCTSQRGEKVWKGEEKSGEWGKGKGEGWSPPERRTGSGTTRLVFDREAKNANSNDVVFFVGALRLSLKH